MSASSTDQNPDSAPADAVENQAPVKQATEVECTVFRCSKRPQMYLYVRKDLAIDDLQPELLAQCGRLVEVMQLSLTAERKLARADVLSVMQSLTERGFYLQLPPSDLSAAGLPEPLGETLLSKR